MSTIVIGDVHCNFRALDNILKRIAPNICAEETVVFLGDYIDRGPNSKDCIERIVLIKAAESMTAYTAV